MAATLTSILIHATFSTKNREPTIRVEALPEMFRYMGGVCRQLKSPLLHAGGVADHVHLLLSLSKTATIADVMMHVKRASSAWMKNSAPGAHRFAWQDGYFAFSIGHDTVGAVRKYLDGQAAHHKHVDFKEEVLAFLAKYKVEHDPKHLWD